MGKLFKVIGILIAVVILLVVAAIIIIPLVVDPNELKAQLTESVKESTGRTLTINDDIGLSVFPWLALEVNQAELSNPAGFEQGTFAKIGTASIRVKLQPLLSSKVEMDTLVLKQVSLNLIRQQDGSDNFSNWGDRRDESGHKDDEGNQDHGGEPQAIAGLTIGGVEITDLNLVFDDRQAGQKLALNKAGLTSGAIVPGETVPIELKALVESSAPAMKADVSLTTSALVDMDAGRVRLNDLVLAIDASGEGVPAGNASLQLNSQVNAALDGSSASLEDLQLNVLDLKLSGKVNATNLNSEPGFKGTLSLAETNLKELLTKLNGEAPVTADPKAMTQLAFKGDFQGTPGSLKLDKLDLQLDDTRFNGHLHINDFAGPAIDFALKGDRLDVDRYMASAGESDPAAGSSDAKPGASEAGSAPPIPLDLLRSLVLNGELKLDWFKVNNLKAENVSLTLRGKGGQLAVEPLSADFYQGRIEQVVRLDVRKDTPVVRAISQLDKVQAEPLLIDLNGETVITGTMNLNSDVTTRGLDAKTATRNLGGKASFTFLDGAYKGFNLGYELRRAKALIKQQPAPAAEAQQTDFAEMSGNAVIKQGVINNTDLLVKAPLLRLQGKGTADLNESQLDYETTVAVVETSKGQGGGALSDLNGLKIPVKAKGPFAKPEVKVDLGKLLKDNLKEKAKEKVEEKVKEKIEEKLGDKLKDKLKGNVLKGLFGN